MFLFSVDAFFIWHKYTLKKEISFEEDPELSQLDISQFVNCIDAVPINKINDYALPINEEALSKGILNDHDLPIVSINDDALPNGNINDDEILTRNKRGRYE